MSLYPYKLFIPEKNEVERKTPRPELTLSGEQAKCFYDSVISSAPCSSVDSKSFTPMENRRKIKAPVKTSMSRQFRNATIFLASQNNDIVTVKEQVRRGININMKDEFGWTALMCAACNGASDVASFLIENGADATIKDRAGYNAHTLARKNSHFEVLKILKRSKHRPKNNQICKTETVPATRFCNKCKVNYSTNDSHGSSTCHLIEEFTSSQPTCVRYSIPEENRGFQMLLKQGWNKREGLGIDGSGRKDPIRAHKKTDRKGIGAKNVSTSTSGLCTTWASADCDKRRNEQQMERTFRLEFSMENPTLSLEYLKQLEAAGDEIITDRQEIVALDIRRNQTREGLRALERTDENKVWMNVGPILMKLERSKVEESLKKDVMYVDAEINKLRSNIKEKVNKLRDMEHQPPVPGLMLSPMTSQEMNAMGQVLGRHVN